MLRENTLFGERDLEKLAISRLREFEEHALELDPDGYYVAFSGGKDSIVMLDLVRKANVKYTAHYNITTVDPPELVRYIIKYYPYVERHRPKKSMFQLIIDNGLPPTRVMRYCCDHLKERSGTDKFIVTGIRWAESTRRSKRMMVESCIKYKLKRYLHPIIDWKDDDIWQYIHENNMPYCSLYDEGFKRIGCIGCPLQGNKAIKEFERWPKFKNAYIRTFDKCIKLNKDRLKRNGEKRYEFKDGQEMFDWWVNYKYEYIDKNQFKIFDD